LGRKSEHKVYIQKPNMEDTTHEDATFHIQIVSPEDIVKSYVARGCKVNQVMFAQLKLLYRIQ